MILCYGVYNWTEKLQDNWEKEDTRSVADAWYTENAYEKDTLVYHWAGPGFAFYVRHNSRYNSNMEEKIAYIKWLSDKSVEGYTNYLNGIYDKNWPKEIYLVASHYGDDLDALIESFISGGYVVEEICNVNEGKLIYMATYKKQTSGNR